jgi:triosephosphate isomerase
MRKPIIAGNWKMNKTVGEAIELVNGLKRALFEVTEVDIVVCPAFTALDEVSEIIYDSNIRLGAQDMHWEDKGAYTGEVSASMLKDVGCEYVIIGHSERREYFGESNEIVNKKVKVALRHNLIPIVCVGERLEERDEGKTFDVVKDHIENGLRDLSDNEILKVVIAYEPVWSIGTGRTATPKQAQEVQKFIRNLLAKTYNEEIAQSIRIQYGGSVRPDNIAELMHEEDIDGALVGGASLELDSFVEIVKRCLVS